MVVGLEAIVELIVGGAIRSEEAQSGGETGTLKTQVEARARAQIAAGTAIPIPADRLAAFEKASLPFPLTGSARSFAFIGEGSTLSIEQRIALGILQRAGPDPRFSPSFTVQRRARSLPLGQIVGRPPGGTSLSDRLRLRDGNLRRTLEHGRRNWRSILTGRTVA